MKKIISFLADNGMTVMPVVGAVLAGVAALSVIIFQQWIIAIPCALTGLWLLAAYAEYLRLD